MTRKTQLALATMAIAGLAGISGAVAKPDGSHGKSGEVHGNSTHTTTANHGSVVSSTAHSTPPGPGHGQAVSSVAKSNHSTSTTYHDSSYKNTYKKSSDKTYKSKTYKSKSTRLNDAARLRNQQIRDAQNNYASIRRSILKNRSEQHLSRSERERLQAAKRERNAAIKSAQNQYRVTVRNIG